MKKSLLLIALTIFLAQAANAATVTFSSGTFDASLAIQADLSGDFSFGMPTVVTGLQQFDPSLGTLTGVSFAVTTGTFSWTADMFGEPMTGADFDAEFTTNIQGDLVYLDGSSGLAVVVAPDSFDLLCVGTEPDSCFDSNDNTLDYTTSSFPIARPLTDFNLADLVGVGNVTNLQLGVGMFGTSFLSVNGLDFVEVFGSADITGATVEVTYEFAPVPVPAAAWLFGSALGLLGWMRRKAA